MKQTKLTILCWGPGNTANDKVSDLKALALPLDEGLNGVHEPLALKRPEI